MTVTLTDCPGTTVAAEGESARLKSLATAVPPTVSCAVAVRETPSLSVPCTVKVAAVAAGALLAAASVSVEVAPGWIVVGLNDAVTPGGSEPDTARAMSAGAPDTPEVPTVKVALAPGATVAVAGESVSVKSPATTLRSAVADSKSERAFPSTSNVLGPPGVTVESAASVSVELPPAWITEGTKVPATPSGWPLSESEMDSDESPLVTVLFTV